MPFTKDDIDAVSITLLANGETAFQMYLTRGGLTQRMGFSERIDPSAILIKGGTDAFEPFMASLPESLLGEGGFLDAGPGDGARHEWRFEFTGGMSSIIYDVTYHAGSASLPDEFADMVVVAERLTHSWYMTLLAEETGMPLPADGPEVAAPEPRSTKPSGKSSSKAPSRPPARSAAPSAKKAPARAGAARAGTSHPITRERLALAILIDFIAWMIPWQFLAWIFGGGAGERTGPPGAGIMLFAVLEFLLLQIVRKSPGYWLLGISAPVGSRPEVDSDWPARESKETLAFGIALCALGVAGLTSWTLWHTPVPYFGLGFPLWLSLPLALIGSAGLILGGGLVLRLDLRGVWVGGGMAVLLLLAALTGFDGWGAFVDAAVAERSEYEGRPVGQGLLGIFLDLVPILVVVVPVLLGAGAFLSWKRFERPGVKATVAPTRS
ncbi:MAG: hypothetical protein ABL963_05635 [Longimicrobiales bacterium]